MSATPVRIPTAVAEAYSPLSSEKLELIQSLPKAEGYGERNGGPTSIWYDNVPLCHEGEEYHWLAKFYVDGWTNPESQKSFFREVEAHVRVLNQLQPVFVENSDDFPILVGFYIPITPHMNLPFTVAHYPGIFLTASNSTCLQNLLRGKGSFSEARRVTTVFAIAAQLHQLFKNNMVIPDLQACDIACRSNGFSSSLVNLGTVTRPSDDVNYVSIFARVAFQILTSNLEWQGSGNAPWGKHASPFLRELFDRCLSGNCESFEEVVDAIHSASDDKLFSDRKEAPRARQYINKVWEQLNSK